MSRILQQSEIREITKRQRYTAQIKALRGMGFEVKIRPDGSPLVSESNFDKVTGGRERKDNNIDVELHLEHLSGASEKQAKQRKRRSS